MKRVFLPKIRQIWIDVYKKTPISRLAFFEKLSSYEMGCPSPDRADIPRLFLARIKAKAGKSS